MTKTMLKSSTAVELLLLYKQRQRRRVKLGRGNIPKTYGYIYSLLYFINYAVFDEHIYFSCHNFEDRIWY